MIEDLLASIKRLNQELSERIEFEQKLIELIEDQRQALAGAKQETDEVKQVVQEQKQEFEAEIEAIHEEYARDKELDERARQIRKQALQTKGIVEV